ncbi:MAG: hypothetical protein MNPFHGCM_00618 [Gemmatimonadaceae bacterium]|nr:hypothetical protein [Gemmatimonadaceae bacterium]
MGDNDESVAGVASLYLGNLLYALERCAMSLEADGQPDGAAFYRGLARKLAEARGRERAGLDGGMETPGGSA